tara:strand:+ start:17038 stop:18177 length:1140 start_codon:yes stop_codon:yes gene_type:complete
MENGLKNKPNSRLQLQYRGVECSNCNHPLDISDKYCPNCSQINSNKKLSIKDFFDEFFASLISYDSKLLKTLAALLLRPGQISIDYIDGKRVRYTNPFRFLLSLSIIYFLLVSYNSNFSEIDQYASTNNGNILDIDGLSLLNATNSNINLDVKEKDEVLKQFDSIQLKQTLNKTLKSRDSTILSNPKLYFKNLEKDNFLKRFFKKAEFFNTIVKNEKIFKFNVILEKYQIESTLENKAAFNGAKGFLKLISQPGSFLNMVISRLPFLIFLFIPVFTLFIWLLYIRKKYNYTEHLIFSFHNQSLLFILLIVSALIDAIFNLDLSAILFFVFGIYLFISMRKFYKQGWFKTFVKFGILNTVFFILAFFSIFILVGTSIFTF